MSEVIPPLEVEFRVAALGGWDNVDVLSYMTDVGSPLRWFAMRGYSGSVNAVRRADPVWQVFDVREHGSEQA